MLRKDYILRQFEEFGKVMAVILSFKKENDWERFEKEIREAVLRFTSMEISYVENLNEENFEKEILKRPGFSSEQQKILADLLFEKLNYYLSKNETDNYLDLRHKCFRLYQYISEHFTQNEFNLDVYYKLEFLKKI